MIDQPRPIDPAIAKALADAGLDDLALATSPAPVTKPAIPLTSLSRAAEELAELDETSENRLARPEPHPINN